MTTIPQPHIGDAKTPLRVHFKLPNGQDWDISTATLVTITVLSPITGTKTVFTGPAGDVVFTTDGSDGLAEHVVSDDFWDEAGDWQVQGYAKLADGTYRHTMIGYHQVAGNL